MTVTPNQLYISSSMPKDFQIEGPVRDTDYRDFCLKGARKEEKSTQGESETGFLRNLSRNGRDYSVVVYSGDYAWACQVLIDPKIIKDALDEVDHQVQQGWDLSKKEVSYEVKKEDLARTFDDVIAEEKRRLNFMALMRDIKKPTEGEKSPAEYDGEGCVIC